MTTATPRTACVAILLGLVCALAPVAAAEEGPATGDEIIRQAVARHEGHATRCEDLTLILTGPRGERSVRTMKSYFRQSQQGVALLRLVIAAPPELSGVTLLLQRQPGGETNSAIYLPAFGPELKRQTTAEAPFLDTEFAAVDFLGEDPDAYQYRLAEDARIDRIDYWVIAAQPVVNPLAQPSATGERRIFVRKDTLFISRIDYLDSDGRVRKRQTRHDLKPAGGRSWQAGMVLMEGIASSQQSLLKRSHTILADDCAPEESFSAATIFATPRQAAGSEPETGSGDSQDEAPQ